MAPSTDDDGGQLPAWSYAVIGVSCAAVLAALVAAAVVYRYKANKELELE